MWDEIIYSQTLERISKFIPHITGYMINLLSPWLQQKRALDENRNSCYIHLQAGPIMSSNMLAREPL